MCRILSTAVWPTLTDSPWLLPRVLERKEREREREREKRQEEGGREREREGEERERGRDREGERGRESVPVWDGWWLAEVRWWVAGRHLTWLPVLTWRAVGGLGQIVFFNCLDLYHKSSDSGEHQYKLSTRKKRFDPTLRAGGRAG